MKVIRKLLTPDEVTPPSIRWNEGTDTVEQTPDGGTTWVDTPELDPRHGNGFRRPPLTGEDARCNAAARQAAAWEEIYGIFMESTSALQFLAIILNILLLLAGGVGVLISLILLLFDALIFIGKENMEAAFSEEVWDEIVCIIYRHIGEDGQVSETELSEIYDEIATTYPGVIYNTLIEIGHLFGEVLLSNASVERGEIGDCDECCENTAFTKYVTFDTGSYPYTVIEGSVVGGGQAGNCAANATASIKPYPGVGQEVFCYVDVLFPAGTTITGITYYEKGQRSDSGSFGVGTGYVIYDEDNNALVTKAYAEDANIGWRLINFGTVSAVGARRVRFRTSMGTSDTGLWTVFAGLDTIAITGVEC